MRYVEVEEAGRLQVSYDGPVLDLMSLAILQAEFANLARWVIGGTLAEQDLLDFPEPPWDHRRNWRFRIPFIRHYPLIESPVRLDCKRISLASPLELELAFSVAYVLANQPFLGVLQSVAGNIISSIGASGVRGIKRLFSGETREPAGDIVDVGPNVRAIATVLAHNADGHRATFRVVSVRGNERQEVVLEIGESE
jgi:hypothetical protein